MRRFYLIIIVILFEGRGIYAEQEKREASSICEFEKFITEKKEFIYGRGKAEIMKGDVEQAMEKAERSAEDEIKEEARRLAESAFLSIVCVKGGCEEMKNQRSFKERVEFYLAAYISERIKDVGKGCEPDEKEKYICCLKRLSKNEIRDIIMDDLEKKKKLVLSTYIASTVAMKKKDVGLALQKLIEAREILIATFSALPIYWGKEIGDEDLIDIDLKTGFEGEIKNILAHMEMDAKEKKLLFGADGRPSRRPYILLRYPMGEEFIPVFNFVVRCAFVEGDGSVENRLSTSRLGVVEPLVYVSPSVPKAVIRCETEVAGIDDLGVPSPSVDVEFVKRTVLSVSITFSNSGMKEVPSFLLPSIKNLVIRKGYEYVDGKGDGEPDYLFFQDLRSQGIDYALFINLSASGGKMGEYGLYYSYAGGSYSLYDARNGKLVDSGEFPSKKGFGATLREAGREALNLLRESLIDLLSRAIPQAVEVR